MKIAFLVLAHKEPEMVRSLCETVARQGADALVHLDAKSDAAPFAGAPLIAERHDVNWGGFGMVRATNALLAAAGDAYDYLYLCSGEDYPVRPLAWLVQHLEAANRARGAPTDFIQLTPMPSAHKPLNRLDRRYANRIPHSQWAWKIRAERVLNFRLFRGPPPSGVLSERGFAPHAGSQWWCLSRSTVEKIEAFRASNPWYDQLMRWTHCPDEHYFQTLAWRFSEGVAPPLTAVYGLEGAMHPETIGLEHFADLEAKPYFMARKWRAGSEAYERIKRLAA